MNQDDNQRVCILLGTNKYSVKILKFEATQLADSPSASFLFLYSSLFLPNFLNMSINNFF